MRQRAISRLQDGPPDTQRPRGVPRGFHGWMAGASEDRWVERYVNEWMMDGWMGQVEEQVERRGAG